MQNSAVLAFDAESVSVLVRATARVSFVLFLVGFVALSAQRAWPAAPTHWLTRRRGSALRALPAVHLVHYGCVLWLGVLTDYANLRARAGGGADWTPIAVGMFALGVMAALAVTAGEGAATQWLRRSRVQTWGLFVLWVFFAVAYTPRAFAEVFYLPFAVALWGALLLRLLYRQPTPASARAAAAR